MYEKPQIDNTILFEFEFVDRDTEQDILRNFLNKHSCKILWIYGESGTGKTFFVKKCLENIYGYDTVYVENKKGTTDGKCIIDIIDELQSIMGQEFYKFFKNHYQGIKAIASDLVDCIPLSKIAKSEFLQYVLGKNFYIIDNNKGYNDMASILKTYTDKFLNDKKIIFVIDNLNQCDENSFNILLNFAKCNIENSNYRFIFISTDSKDGNEPFEKKLSKELPYKNLCIPKIPDEEYFINMLPRKFDITNLTSDDISKIYFYCKGLPEQFQDLLANLNKNHSIEYVNTRIMFNREDILQYILAPDKYGLDIDNYNPFQKCALLVILCIGIPVRIDFLLKLSRFCYQQMFGLSLSIDKCMEEISALQPKPLRIILKSTGTFFYTDHDLTYNTALMYFENNHMYPMFCDYIYNFLLKEDNPSQLAEIFDETAKKEIFANLSFDAKQMNWIFINYECGIHFFKVHNFIQAFKYFRRLLNSKANLDDKKTLIIGITAYEVGEYSIACKILDEVTPENIENVYQYFMFKGKSYNMMAREEEALDFFEMAILYAIPESDDENYAKYMKYLVLLQLPQFKTESKKLYVGLVEDILYAYQNKNERKLYLISNAKILRCCYDYYFNEEALYLYEIAEKIADYCDDRVEKASILHNKGFEYIRQNEISKGLELFKKSFDLLENIKRHDAAYCLNNIAICKMFKKEYYKAIDDLKKVLLYEKSYYLYLTATTMLMQCYRIVKNPQYYYLKKELDDIIRDTIYKDPAIIRKICMNLAICEYEEGNIINAKNYLTKIWHFIRNTSSEFRAFQLKERLFNDKKLDKEEYLFKRSDFFNIKDFEPWFITLSHD